MIILYYVGHCPFSEVYLIYMTFLELIVLPSSGDWLSYSFIITFTLTAAVKIEPGTFRIMN